MITAALERPWLVLAGLALGYMGGAMVAALHGLPGLPGVLALPDAGKP